MPVVSFTQKEIDALLGAVVSREMELADRMHDAHQTIHILDDYGDDCEITDDDIAEANAELDEAEAESDALERAALKLARVRK